MSHFHHDHPATPTGGTAMAEPVRNLLAVIVVTLAVATAIGLIVWWPRGEAVLDRSALSFGDQANATVINTDVGPCSYDDTTECNTVTFEITSGAAEGLVASVPLTTALACWVISRSANVHDPYEDRFIADPADRDFW